jgi:hypothetical protein
MSRVSKSFVWGWILVTGCGGASLTTSPDAGEGGPGPSGVDASDGAVDAPLVCSSNSIEFVLQVAAGSSQSFCNGGPWCVGNWLTIFGPDGAPISLGDPCATDCNGCQPAACPGDCDSSSPIGGGLQEWWDGTVYVSSTCGAGTSCEKRDCAGAGNYTARMCVYAEAGPVGVCTAIATSVEVPFVWPPASSAGWVVRGTVGSDGG